MAKGDGDIEPAKITFEAPLEKTLGINDLQEKVSRLEKKDKYWDPKWVIGIIIAILIPSIGGAYKIGWDNGYSRFDREKIEYERDNQDFKKKIDSLHTVIRVLNMPKKLLSRDELLKHLNDNIRFLEISSNSFDQGYFEEAKRLAVTIRVLVHDTINSNSVLKQLDLKEGNNFYNTSSPYNPKNIVEYSGLVRLQFDSSGINYKAPLSESIDMPGRANEFIPFSDWWNGIIIKDNKGITYTRKQLVLILANKDGGAHVDPNISEDYKALREADRTNWAYVQENGSEETSTPIKNVEFHSMRQIAYELMVSIKRMI